MIFAFGATACIIVTSRSVSPPQPWQVAVSTPGSVHAGTAPDGSTTSTFAGGRPWFFEYVSRTCLTWSSPKDTSVATVLPAPVMPAFHSFVALYAVLSFGSDAIAASSLATRFCTVSAPTNDCAAAEKWCFDGWCPASGVLGTGEAPAGAANAVTSRVVLASKPDTARNLMLSPLAEGNSVSHSAHDGEQATSTFVFPFTRKAPRRRAMS